jgi:hypothetical protein
VGQLYAIRTPRGVAVERVNECSNPSFEVSDAGWTYLWSGTAGAATNARIATQYANVGGYVLSKTWTTTATTTAVMAGFQYATGWAGGAAKSIRAVMQSNGHNQYVGVQVDFTDATGNVLGQATSAPFAAIAGGWVPVSLTNAVAPPGTWYGNVKFGIFAGATPPVAGDSLWLDAVGMYAGATLYPYWDGSTAASGSYTYSWSGTVGLSASYRNIPDPATDVRPALVQGYDTTRAARNAIHQFLSGSVGVALYPSSLRSGTLRLFFDDPAAAATAEKSFAAAGTWAFADDANPAEGMTFVVAGAVRSYQTDNRLRRVLEIPYQEITA